MNPPSLEWVMLVGAVGLVAIGAAGLVVCTHLYRMVLALAVAEAGGNLLLVSAGYRWDAVAPILLGGSAPGPMVDPVPQALVLTSIVIGVGVQALAVALLIRVHRAYRTLDIRVLRRLLDADIADAAGVARPGSQEAPCGEHPLPLPQSAAARVSQS
jgi:multisubunit Na+/H+ antiporter MnhC subunit